MNDALAIQPISAFTATVRPPGSKSLTNRALLLAALSQRSCRLSGVLFADDTRRMLTALPQLGINIEIDEPNQQVIVHGRGGIPAPRADLDLGNAGTAYRFLTAACCLGRGVYTLDGVARMRQRPIGQLVQALQQLGAQIAYLGTPEYPPLRIHAVGLAGGTIELLPTLSSQYLSALLQIAPLTRRGLTLHFRGAVTSRPYVAMTLALMAQFGVAAAVDPAFTRITITSGNYAGGDYAIEPDASSASYFLAAAALVPGSKCTITGLGRSSLQGDVGFADVLHQMGVDLLFGNDFLTVMTPKNFRARGIDIDLSDMPDMAQTLAVVALFAVGPTLIRNIGNLRVKETDRLAALRNELTKFGAQVEIAGDDLHIIPPADGCLIPPAGGVDTYDDHRMAMSFALIGLRLPGVVINNPTCVAKTFPDFFEYLGRLGRE